MSEATLYERLGGEEGIRAIVNDVVANHHVNPAVKARFDNASKTDAELADLVVDFIGAGTGGPQEYQGMDMREAHRGMNVSEAEFVGVLDDILAALDKHGVGAREQAELLAISYSMKGDIVHV